MKRTIRKALALIIVFALLMSATTVYAVEGTEAMNDRSTLTLDTLPVTDYVSGVSPYDGTVTVLSESEARGAGVPAGFSGSVTRVGVGSNSSYAGVTFDFASLGLPVSEIEEMTFRVYLAGGGTSLRISNKGAGSWAVLATVSSNAWVDYTVKADGTGFNNTSFGYFKNESGNIGVFGMGAKSVSYLYIDSIKVVFADGYVYESDDETPPVLSYSGASELSYKEGDVFYLDGLYAFDEYDNASATVTYEWSDGAVNAAGKLECGTHVCTVRATDRSGNSSTLTLTVTVTPDPSLIRIEDVPHIPHDITIADNAAYAGTATELTEQEALAKGLPSGYKGSVYEITSSNTSYVGVCIDLSHYEIPIALVESVSFRVLVPTTFSELRMRNGNTSDWIMRNSSAPTGGWTTVTLGADGLNFFGSTSMKTLANDEGNLGSFALIGRVSAGYAPYYIDSIVVELKDDDKVAPVLSYSGKTDILTSAEKVFAPEISAFDEQENREIALTYEWSDGALDESGLMVEGIHTCRVSAADYFGNTSFIDFNVTVGAKDVTPPDILFVAEEIVVPVGTYSRLVILCVDDYDDVDVVMEWSDGAIDFGGRLAEGVHTLTLTATDLTGNVSVRVVTVRVTSGESTVGTLIQCGK